MLKRSALAIEKWKGFDNAIDRWLDERHDLILQLTNFASDHNFRSSNPKTEEKIRTFTTVLIDYISAGHFEFYQQLVEEGREFGDQAALAKAPSLLEAIDISTESALDFNEKYSDLTDLSEIASDLSTLAESLVVRFDAEDEMINTLHKAHNHQLSA